MKNNRFIVAYVHKGTETSFFNMNVQPMKLFSNREKAVEYAKEVKQHILKGKDVHAAARAKDIRVLEILDDAE